MSCGGETIDLKGGTEMELENSIHTSLNSQYKQQRVWKKLNALNKIALKYIFFLFLILC